MFINILLILQSIFHRTPFTVDNSYFILKCPYKEAIDEKLEKKRHIALTNICFQETLFGSQKVEQK